MKAGLLRHRITIQSFISDNSTGVLSESWADLATDLPAAVHYASGREFNAAAANQAEAATRFTIRYRNDLAENMRITHEGRTFNIVAILPDDSLRDALTVMAVEGVNAG